MHSRLIGLIIIFLVAAGYLALREWSDRKKEKAQDREIVREDEEYLGTWASKSPEALIKFRLHRDGKFSYTLVRYANNDTTNLAGSYEVIGTGGGRDAKYYPRLIAVSDKNDTLLNYFIAYITAYDAHALDRGYDKMVLNPKGRLDTTGYVFYRVKEK